MFVSEIDKINNNDKKQHLIYYWPNFYQTLKAGFWIQQQQQYFSYHWPNFNQTFVSFWDQQQ